MTTTTITTWPDTTRTPPPAHSRYAAAEWLLGRHPQVARLAARVPGVVTPDERTGAPDLDLDTLVHALDQMDATRAARQDYERRVPPPSTDRAYDRWEAAGPQHTPGGEAIAVMSRTEAQRLRVLATLADDGGRLAVGDLTGFDAAGETYLRDWLTAIRAVLALA